MDGGAGLIAAAAVKPICLWCDSGFEPRKGGSPQRFCNSKCRDAFHSAGRRWAEMAVSSGLLTAADLRHDRCPPVIPTRHHLRLGVASESRGSFSAG